MESRVGDFYFLAVWVIFILAGFSIFSTKTYERNNSKNKAHAGHKIPKSKGGRGNPDNGQVLCRDCNTKKGAE